MIVKAHKGPNGKIVLAVCDKEILGKKFEEKNMVLDLGSDFYNGSEKSEKEVLKLFSDAYIVNLAGKNSVECGKKAGIVLENNIINICGVPHAQVILL